jgi:2-oxoglutarate-dependent dioxygenase
MNTPANVSSGKPWHQDGAYFDTEDQVIIVWIPLQDVTAVNGCLHAISGSHNWGKLEHRGAEAQLDPAALPLDLVRQYPVRSGGVCVMEKHTVHYSGTN